MRTTNTRVQKSTKPQENGTVQSSTKNPQPQAPIADHYIKVQIDGVDTFVPFNKDSVRLAPPVVTQSVLTNGVDISTSNIKSNSNKQSSGKHNNAEKKPYKQNNSKNGDKKHYDKKPHNKGGDKNVVEREKKPNQHPTLTDKSSKPHDRDGTSRDGKKGYQGKNDRFDKSRKDRAGTPPMVQVVYPTPGHVVPVLPSEIPKPVVKPTERIATVEERISQDVYGFKDNVQPHDGLSDLATPSPWRAISGKAFTKHIERIKSEFDLTDRDSSMLEEYYLRQLSMVDQLHKVIFGDVNPFVLSNGFVAHPDVPGMFQVLPPYLTRAASLKTFESTWLASFSKEHVFAILQQYAVEVLKMKDVGDFADTLKVVSGDEKYNLLALKNYLLERIAVFGSTKQCHLTPPLFPFEYSAISTASKKIRWDQSLFEEVKKQYDNIRDDLEMATRLNIICDGTALQEYYDAESLVMIKGQLSKLTSELECMEIKLKKGQFLDGSGSYPKLFNVNSGFKTLVDVKIDNPDRVESAFYKYVYPVKLWLHRWSRTA